MTILALNQRAVDGLLAKIDALEREVSDLRLRLDAATVLKMDDYTDDDTQDWVDQEVDSYFTDHQEIKEAYWSSVADLI